MKEIKMLLSFLFLNSSLIGQNFKWAVGEGSNAYDIGRAVTTDNIGNVYISGVFTDTVDFDPGSSVFNLIPSGTLGGHEIFVQKLDSSGNFVWAKKFGGIGSEWVNDIEVDNSGNIFVIGSFMSTADFDPGFGTYNLTSYGGEDAFLLRLNSLGNLVWAKQFGGPSTDIGAGIILDPPNNIYLTGNYRFTADIDPSTTSDLILNLQPGDYKFDWYNVLDGLFVEARFGTVPIGFNTLVIDYPSLTITDPINDPFYPILAFKAIKTHSHITIQASDSTITNKDIKLDLEFNVIPNPASNTFSIFFSNQDNEFVNVRIISSNGNVVYNESKNSSSNEIDISKFENGIYFVCVTGENFIQSKKLVVQRNSNNY